MTNVLILYDRYSKTKDQEFVEYLADGVKIGEEMRYKAETTEGERFGDGQDTDPHAWDSLSTRMRRQRRHHPSRNHLQKQKGSLLLDIRKMIRI